jgi:hypothetical protein
MDSNDTKNELLNWIDCNIYGLKYCLEKVKLISLISEVLKRLPSQDRKILMYKRGVRFIAPITKNSITEQIFIDPISDRSEKTALCQCSKCNESHFISKNGIYDMMVGIWLVCLSPEILKRSKEQSLYTIAKQLAHVYFEIPQTIDGIEENSELEKEAAKQVIKWGFKSEIRQKQFNYKCIEKIKQNEFSVDAI